MISVAENRVAALSSMIGARSGFTNRERRALNREAKILRRWLFPDAETPGQRRRQLNRLKNQRRAIITTRRRKPTKRRAREARRDYREQRALQKRPDYTQPVVCGPERRKRLIRLRRVQQAKQAWFERKHGKEESMPVCSETAHVVG